MPLPHCLYGCLRVCGSTCGCPVVGFEGSRICRALLTGQGYTVSVSVGACSGAEGLLPDSCLCCLHGGKEKNGYDGSNRVTTLRPWPEAWPGGCWASGGSLPGNDLPSVCCVYDGRKEMRCHFVASLILGW